MARLQQIKRSNGSIVSYVNLPLDLVEEAGWVKGDELAIVSEGTGSVVRLVITREKDGI